MRTHRQHKLQIHYVSGHVVFMTAPERPAGPRCARLACVCLKPAAPFHRLEQHQAAAYALETHLCHCCTSALCPRPMLMGNFLYFLYCCQEIPGSLVIQQNVQIRLASAVPLGDNSIIAERLQCVAFMRQMFDQPRPLCALAWTCSSALVAVCVHEAYRLGSPIDHLAESLTAGFMVRQHQRLKENLNMSQIKHFLMANQRNDFNCHFDHINISSS